MRYAALALVTLLFSSPALGAGVSITLHEVEQLGKHLYFDKSLSDPAGQACATCHDPAAGWAGESAEVNAGESVYRGARAERAGNRKPPSVAYATQSPVLHFDPKEQHFVGGSFWDGRATGWLLGNPAAEQAQGPYVNPVEHNLRDEKTVVEMVCGSDYAPLFKHVYGEGICKTPLQAYNAVGQALAAFESSREVNAFSSKYDYYLKNPKKYPLSKQELRGLRLFENEKKGNCAACHPSRPDRKGNPPLFTDYTYDNLGIPKNPRNPWYTMPKELNPDGAAWVDPGLGGFLATVPRFAKHSEESLGKHKVPTLRNVDKRPHPGFVKAFGHNGYFKSLEEIVRFYNLRDVLPACSKKQDPQPNVNCWPEPEERKNLNTEEMGKLGLTPEEEKAIVAFMKTLTDGWTPAGK